MHPSVRACAMSKGASLSPPNGAKGSVLNITYKVAELGRRMAMIVMEVESTSGLSAGRNASGVVVRVPGPQ